MLTSLLASLPPDDVRIHFWDRLPEDAKVSWRGASAGAHAIANDCITKASFTFVDADEVGRGTLEAEEPYDDDYVLGGPGPEQHPDAGALLAKLPWLTRVSVTTQRDPHQRQDDTHTYKALALLAARPPADRGRVRELRLVGHTLSRRLVDSVRLACPALTSLDADVWRVHGEAFPLQPPQPQLTHLSVQSHHFSSSLLRCVANLPSLHSLAITFVLPVAVLGVRDTVADKRLLDAWEHRLVHLTSLHVRAPAEVDPESYLTTLPGASPVFGLRHLQHLTLVPLRHTDHVDGPLPQAEADAQLRLGNLANLRALQLGWLYVGCAPSCVPLRRLTALTSLGIWCLAGEGQAEAPMPLPLQHLTIGPVTPYQLLTTLVTLRPLASLEVLDTHRLWGHPGPLEIQASWRPSHAGEQELGEDQLRRAAQLLVDLPRLASLELEVDCRAAETAEDAAQPSAVLTWEQLTAGLAPLAASQRLLLESVLWRSATFPDGIAAWTLSNNGGTRAMFPHLSTLRLDHCSVSDNGLVAVVNGHPAMVALHVDECPGPTDAGWTRLGVLTGLGRPQHLTVSVRPTLTDHVQAACAAQELAMFGRRRIFFGTTE